MIQLNDIYVFKQEINARINLKFPTPIQGIHFYELVFEKGKDLEKEQRFKNWDDPRLLDMVRDEVEQKGFSAH